jgi:hypothetical protein
MAQAFTGRGQPGVATRVMGRARLLGLKCAPATAMWTIAAAVATMAMRNRNHAIRVGSAFAEFVDAYKCRPSIWLMVIVWTLQHIMRLGCAHKNPAMHLWLLRRRNSHLSMLCRSVTSGNRVSLVSVFRSTRVLGRVERLGHVQPMPDNPISLVYYRE